ncbi:GNAT family N-acetyltransferase [Mycolicibacterium agri]|uniref:N-acetyltransferase n=1 Tax=Mycolicibacterium agri TaxID=36811 RepID=A0A2A7MRZ0_MYCAG|nr:GNAT family N-acetyltransferase [Mycolicibacterium agri]PEG34263.1 GNAT family N-acetyltransferase [Mycolicibacterium agri]GFG49720.1 N-acetyltransferase [Mycolicibacterium agri]
MTDDQQKAERREIADTLVRALERRHELLDVIVASEDYDAAVEAIAGMLGTSTSGAEAVLGLSFDRLTKVSRRRIRDELEDLNHELSFTIGHRKPAPGESLMLRPFKADVDRDVFAARTEDVRAAGDGSGAPAGDLDDEIRAAEDRMHAEEAVWLVALDGSEKVGMVFGELANGEVNVRIWIHPAYRKQGYGTAALRKSRSEMAAYFPAVPLVVRAPAAGA